MQAAKFSQDRYYTNTHYARVGGLPPQELKALELEFLARIFYTLWADPEVIGAWTNHSPQRGCFAAFIVFFSFLVLVCFSSL
jgi:hypothetical protein